MVEPIDTQDMQCTVWTWPPPSPSRRAAQLETFHTFFFFADLITTLPGLECACRRRSFFAMFPNTVSLTAAALTMLRGRCWWFLIRLIAGRCLCFSTSASSYSRFRRSRALPSVARAFGVG